MKVKLWIAMLFLTIAGMRSLAQLPLVYDAENTGVKFKSPVFRPIEELPVIDPLPDPFILADGKRTTKFADWERRRNEIGAAFQHYEIGTKPSRPGNITATYTPDSSSNGGTLTVVVTVNEHSLTLTSKVLLPKGTGPFPAVIGMNSPNGSIPSDIFTTRSIARISFMHNQVTVYNKPQNTDPFFQLYPNQNIDNTGQYAAWAWGVSRIIDGLELVKATLPIDLKHLAVTGCSYAGKMALISGAFDERIALTIAQESGGGGATAWRVSETLGDVEKLGATSYQWFKDDMIQFAGLNVSKLPEDHHELMAMVAPRALLVTGNTDYFWLANPSCYVAARAAHEVWKQFGIGDRFGFYIDGKHQHCAVPEAERPYIEAFVDKFLVGKKDVNTDVTVNPFPGLNYQRWFQWWGTKNAVFPGEDKAVKIWLEPECGTVGSNWDILDDPNASGGKYVTIKSGMNSTRTAPKDTATNLVVIPFTIETPGNYNFLARAIGPTANDDSYWVKVDDGAYASASGLIGTTWTWNRLTSAQLSAGTHKLTVTYREDGAKLDKILITTSSASSAMIPGAPGINCR